VPVVGDKAGAEGTSAVHLHAERVAGHDHGDRDRQQPPGQSEAWAWPGFDAMAREGPVKGPKTCHNFPRDTVTRANSRDHASPISRHLRRFAQEISFL
jgi:hypothetical protein